MVAWEKGREDLKPPRKEKEEHFRKFGLFKEKGKAKEVIRAV
jgi:hypothetical protein